jgi:hypothetical protein
MALVGHGIESSQSRYRVVVSSEKNWFLPENVKKLVSTGKCQKIGFYKNWFLPENVVLNVPQLSAHGGAEVVHGVADDAAEEVLAKLAALAARIPCKEIRHLETGLPDFSWSMIPKLANMYQMNTKFTKWS